MNKVTERIGLLLLSRGLLLTLTLGGYACASANPLSLKAVEPMTFFAQEPNLEAAVETANQHLASHAVSVNATSTNPSEPVYLTLTDKMGTHRIGIVHLVKLIGTSPLPFRTQEEVVASILQRVNLYIQSKQNKHLYIDENGTIFDFGTVKVERREDHTFLVNGKLVTFSGQPLALTRIKSEGVIRFRELENGHIALNDGLDQRAGKGLFIDEEGQIYRA